MQTVKIAKPGVIGRFVIGTGAAFLIGLGLFYLVMGPPTQDLILMIELMGATALISIVATYAAYRVGWITRSPRLLWTLIGGYFLAGLLVFMNVYISARMMFANQHDLTLATILLVFATGIAMAVGFFLAETVTSRIQQLTEAARQVASGSLDIRLQVNGRDEMALLAHSFNDMVAQLQAADRKQKELDLLRRDLVAWAGHDLRTPLTAIRAIIEALADGVINDDDTRQHYLRTAQANVQSLSHLIDDLFVMSQVDAGGLQLNLEQGAISDLISDTLEKFSTRANEQEIELAGYVSPGCDPVGMDIQRIDRVLSNLVGNALRHTPRHGSIMIRVGRVDQYVMVSVQDTGEGIRSEDLPYVFDRFYRGEKSRNPATGGAGLGLAIAKGIVEAHHGMIGIESKIGEGTHVWFKIPVIAR